LLKIDLVIEICSVIGKHQENNQVSPWWGVIVLARLSVSAARPPTRPAAAGKVSDDDWRQTTTDASQQNNTGLLGGPVINAMAKVAGLPGG